MATNGDSQAKDASQKQRIRAVTAASIGNFVEWYDFAIYGYLAVYIGQQFFPSENETTSLLASFAAFGTAFIFRPLGGFVLGPLADRIGRQKVLVLVIALMSGTTFLIGVLPTFGVIGVLAPVLLVLARCVQGFSAGGEFGGGAAFMAEYSKPNLRGFTTSFLEFSIQLAYLVGTSLILVLTVTLSDDDMAAWGWRIPFILGGLIGVVGFYIRSKLEDTPAFQQIDEQGKTADAPMREVFRTQKKPMLQLAGLTSIQWIGLYIVFIYTPTYLTEQLGHTSLDASLSTLCTLVVAAILIPVLGRVSDRVGRKPILFISACLSAIVSYPLFLLITSDSMAVVILGHVLVGIPVAGFLSTTIAALTELFPTHVRVGAFSISYGVMGALLGGTTPFIVTALLASTGNLMVPAIMLIIGGVVSALTVLTIKETAHIPLQ
ncbi:MAG TPA: MFS transporter [Candidatus Yaniella excrementigallinarum]|nr:MFS transporter [Candidatus Yaniella excrementigallinarum]